MRNSNTEKALVNLLKVIDETDIRMLVYAPPIIGVVGFLVWVYVMDRVTNGSISNISFDFALGTVSLLQCISGISEIRRKEMPGPFGRTIKGKIAIISGAIITVFFGIGGLYFIAHGMLAIF